MPYLVSCPKCSAKLKSSQPVPAGRTLSCPNCKSTFTLSEPAPEVGAATSEVPKAVAPVEQPKPAARAPAPAAPPAPIVPPPLKAPAASAAHRPADEEVSETEIVDAADFDRNARPSRRNDNEDPPRSRRREDDHDDRPRSRNRDDDDDRVRSRRRDDDDRGRSRNRDDDYEDRPRSRSREDDYEDRGRSRRRDDDDDRDRGRSRSRDEEEPRNRKTRDDEDDDSPAPIVRSPYRNRKKGSRGLLIGLLAGGAGLLLILFLVLFFVIDPFNIIGGGAPSEMLAFAPADTQAITTIDMNEARNIDDFRNNFIGNADGNRIGLRNEDIAMAMTASKVPGFLGFMAGEPDVVVFKLNASADQTKIVSASGGKEASANGKKYFKTNTGGAVYFPSSRLVVVARTDSIMTGLLQKSDSKVVISDDLRSAVSRANGTVATASVGSAAENGDLVGMIAGQGGGLGPGFGIGPRGSRAKSTVFSSKVSGSRGTLKLESTYDSSETARRISDDARRNMESRVRSSDVETWNVSQSGSTVTLTITGPVKSSGRGNLFPFGK